MLWRLRVVFSFRYCLDYSVPSFLCFYFFMVWYGRDNKTPNEGNKSLSWLRLFYNLPFGIFRSWGNLNFELKFQSCRKLFCLHIKKQRLAKRLHVRFFCCLLWKIIHQHLMWSEMCAKSNQTFILLFLPLASYGGKGESSHFDENCCFIISMMEKRKAPPFMFPSAARYWLLFSSPPHEYFMSSWGRGNKA